MESPRKSSRCHSASNLSTTASVPMMALMTDAEIEQLKEHNQRRVKRVVALVAVTITTIAVIMVALSLSLGPKIDQLVSESLESANMSNSAAALFIVVGTTSKQQDVLRMQRINNDGMAF